VVDKAKLDQMLSNLRRYLGVLRELAAVPRESFLGNSDKIVVLSEHGLLPNGSRDALRAMARFRNRLVHLYWDVDDGRVHEYLQERLGDIERFGAAITRREW
jgi:Protein of unknown function DUF86